MMAAVSRGIAEDSRRAALSPRPKGRENSKETLCRNVTIYGHCRYEDKGCAFNHDPIKVHMPTDGSKKRLNVDSPAFTPASQASTLAVNGGTTKLAGLSPKIVSAAPFQPKGYGSSVDLAALANKSYNPSAPDWSNGSQTQDLSDYIPHSQMMDTAPVYDNYQQSINLYAPELGGSTGTGYYQGSTYTQLLQYHLYAPLGPHREAMAPYQRAVHDFFISDHLREDLQRKTAATVQTLPNSSLPPRIEYLHSLVPLDISNQKNAIPFGYPSWIYKAVSAKDGNTYALRRIEGFRLTNEMAVRSVQAWKGFVNASVVSIIDVFTNRSFGDSSLMVVTDYHPLAQTLAEAHLKPSSHQIGSRHRHVPPTEKVMWSYMVQMANALKAIHSAGLAARVIEPSKILVTSPNIIRLNACAILDVLQFDQPQALVDLQRNDLAQAGHVFLGLAIGKYPVVDNVENALTMLSHTYSTQLLDCMAQLAGANTNPAAFSIDDMMPLLAPHILDSFNASFHQADNLRSELSRELENSRLVRLLTKINFINERPDFSHDLAWAETGTRYHIKLFRDYVFHQVDRHGSPVLDLAHVLACLNKLDAGVEERIALTSRDEATSLVVSYKEMKRAIEGAFADLQKAARRGQSLG